MSDNSPHRPKVVLESTRPFRELLEGLNAGGFDASHQSPYEQRSLETLGEAFALFVGEKLAQPELDRLVGLVKAWVREWLRPWLRRGGRDGSGITVPIYGPRGEVLSRVEVDEDA